MEVEKIDRINALAHKAKSVGLTEEEKKEQAELLRKEYIASVRHEPSRSAGQCGCSEKKMDQLIWVKNMESKKDIRKRFSQKESCTQMNR